MEELLLGLAGLAGLAALLQQKPTPSEQDYQKALEKLKTSPQDPAANLTAGKYLAFVLGDFPAALPFFQASGEKTLKSLADHELDPTNVGTPPQKVAMGDEWVQASRKFPTLARNLYDRAAHWYGTAWPQLDGVWKDRTRTQLRKLFQNAGVNDPKGLAAPGGWKVSDQNQRGMATTKAYRTGRASFQVVAQKKADPLSIALQQDVNPVPGATYDFSAWALPDGTDTAGDQVAVTIFGVGGKPVSVQRLFVPPDEPWWHYLHMTFKMPDEAQLLWVQIAVASRGGNLYVDDISLKAEGRETLKNGSFEEK